MSTSTDPLGGIAAWRGGGPTAGEYDTLSCPSGSLCVGSCPTGVGFNGQACSGKNYDAGTIVSWNPATWQVSSPTGVQFAQISTQPLTGVWCESNTLCFATNGNLLYGTVNPDGGASGWRPIANATSVDGVACPSPTRCDAVTNGGAVLLGSPPPTKAQIVSLLRREISPRRTLRASVLLHRGGYSFVFNAPTAGRLHISWYVLQRTGNGSGVLVGAVSHRYPGPTTDTLKLKLTPEGARVLTRPNTRLLVTASFNAPGAAVTTKGHWQFDNVPPVPAPG